MVNRETVNMCSLVWNRTPMGRKMLEFAIDGRNWPISVSGQWHSRRDGVIDRRWLCWFPCCTPLLSGEAYYKHYSIKCRSPMINIVWSTFNAISTKQSRAAKSVVVFYTKIDFFSIFQPKRKIQQVLFSVLHFRRFRCGCAVDCMWSDHVAWSRLDIRPDEFQSIPNQWSQW